MTADFVVESDELLQRHGAGIDSLEQLFHIVLFAKDFVRVGLIDFVVDGDLNYFSPVVKYLGKFPLYEFGGFYLAINNDCFNVLDCVFEFLFGGTFQGHYVYADHLLPIDFVVVMLVLVEGEFQVLLNGLIVDIGQ